MQEALHTAAPSSRDRRASMAIEVCPKEGFIPRCDESAPKRLK
jgi:hypothetical protein